MKSEDAATALLQACHRALDDLDRLNAVQPIIWRYIGAEYNEAARGQCSLYRWRSAEAGNAEERCFILRIA
jgi:hypothetical protein